MLQRAGDVAEVGGGAEQDGVGAGQVVDGGIESLDDLDIHAL